MMYATVQDLVDRFGAVELTQLTDPELAAVQTARVQRAIDDAQAYVDSFVGRVYQLPLAGCTKPAPTAGDTHATQQVAPPQLARITADVARYYLYKDFAPEAEVYLRYKAATAELEALASGRAVLNCPWGGPAGVLLVGALPGEAEVLHGFAPRAVTDDALRGFA